MDEERLPTLAERVRAQFDLSWGKARERCERGQIFVDGEPRLDPAERISPSAKLEFRPNRARPRAGELDRARLLYADRELAIVDKPANLLTLPYERGDRDTLVDQTRALLKRLDRSYDPELSVVQRLDKGTTGVLVFARTLAAKRALKAQFRERSVERVYLALVHGEARDHTHESYLIGDRGDGIRGSHGVFRRTRKGPPPESRYAKTEVRLMERLRGASLVECRLHTGRQHQIRIHLSEDGNSLIGETVYRRELSSEEIPVSRPMLHALSVGFDHPRTGERISLRAEPPDDFRALYDSLRLAP